MKINFKACNRLFPHPSRLSNCQHKKFLIRNANRKITTDLELTKAKFQSQQIKMQTIQLENSTLGENLP